MALKSLDILARPETIEIVARASMNLKKALHDLHHDGLVAVRGRGLMVGLELEQNAGQLLAELLSEGLIFLADGPAGNVLSFTPPFVISDEEIEFAVGKVSRLLRG